MSADKELPVVAWMDEGQTGGYGQPVSRVCTDVSKRDMPRVMADAMCIPLTYANAASARIAELEQREAELESALAVTEYAYKDMTTRADKMEQKLAERDEQLEQARKDADRWRAMRQTFVAVDWAWNSPPIPVAIFELHANTVRGGPSGADEVADAAIASRGTAQEVGK
jgi:hypothetical protein